MSGLRLRVSWNSEKLVVPVSRQVLDTGSVADLLALVTARFRQFSTVSFDADNSFVQLLTADGFAFAQADSLHSVLTSDDHLVVRRAGL